MLNRQVERFASFVEDIFLSFLTEKVTQLLIINTSSLCVTGDKNS